MLPPIARESDDEREPATKMGGPGRVPLPPPAFVGRFIDRRHEAFGLGESETLRVEACDGTNFYISSPKLIC